MLKSKFIIPLIILLAAGCNNKEVYHNKDLSQNMLDMRIYQENLGDYLEKNKLEDASWLLEEMDSILLILNRQFKEHRKLDAPFSYYYKKQMETPINGIRDGIRTRDTGKALQHYRILINNCNDCHIDHEIDKKVNY